MRTRVKYRSLVEAISTFIYLSEAAKGSSYIAPLLYKQSVNLLHFTFIQYLRSINHTWWFHQPLHLNITQSRQKYTLKPSKRSETCSADIPATSADCGSLLYIIYCLEVWIEYNGKLEFLLPVLEEDNWFQCFYIYIIDQWCYPL